MSRISEAEVSDLFALLRDDGRRTVVMALRQDRPSGDPTVREGELMDDAKREAKIELRQNHLPRLEEAGIIEWDRDADQIRRGPNFEKVRPFLRAIDEVTANE